MSERKNATEEDTGKESYPAFSASHVVKQLLRKTIFYVVEMWLTDSISIESLVDHLYMINGWFCVMGTIYRLLLLNIRCVI